MQQVHWDPDFARQSGNPTTFDYGRMRETWLIHLCTDWMGDDAWLWKLDCEFRLFNYVGDTQWLRGTVARRYLAEGGRPAVDLDIACTNQRGDVTTPGRATVLLPRTTTARWACPTRRPPTCRAPSTSRRPLGGPVSGPGGPGEPAARPSDHVRVGPGDDGVLRLHLDKPAKRNALDDDMVATLIDRSTPPGDEAVRGILVTAAGDHFCSGFDIVGRNAGDSGAARPASARSSAGCRRRPTG